MENECAFIFDQKYFFGQNWFFYFRVTISDKILVLKILPKVV